MMPYPILDTSELGSQTPANRKRWTREDCDFLERVGLLTGRYELLDGEIIVKMGQNQPHAMSVSRLVFYLLGIFGPAHVQTQTTIEVLEADRVTNRPEPDAVVLDRPDFEYSHTPRGDELRLAVEVSDSTLGDDLRTKARLYARAGVPEYWVLDVASRRLVVHRDPHENEYRSVVPFSESESVAPLAAPDHPLTVADLLPPVRPVA